jgi:N-acetylmuramoyl-L-alanine amidase
MNTRTIRNGNLSQNIDRSMTSPSPHTAMRTVSRLAPWFVLLLFPLLVASARAEVSSLTVIHGGKKFTVPAFQHNRILYASLTEFGKKLSWPAFQSEEYKKYELRIGESRAKFTADNPFVVVVAQKDNTIREVLQLPYDVMKTDVAWYGPIAGLLPLFSRSMQQHMELDLASLTLTIGGKGSVAARVVGALASSNDAKSPAAEKNAQPGKTKAPSATTDTAAKNTSPRSERPASARSSADDTATPPSAELAPRAIKAEAVSTFDISRLTVDSRKNGVLIRIHMRKEPKHFASELVAGTTLVVSVNGASVDENEIRQTPIDGESITAVNAELLGDNTRLIFSLDGEFTENKISRDVRSNDLLVSLFKKVDMRNIAAEEQGGGRSRDRTKWKLDCIVLDPGHGGKDPGAIGVSGIKEKNIVLGVALKLGKMISDRMPGVRVEYTRKDDTFVPLDKRGQMANNAGGKLFVSLHCNSTEKKPSNARGFEVYILRPGRTAEALRVAEFENSVIKLEKDYETRYAKLTDENFILVNMAQSAYVKYSERFAEMLHEEVKRGKQMSSKGVKQAGFYVLVGASMPSVLIEMGFLSNAREEQYLATQEGQQHMAERFFEAIRSYAEEYEKSLQE